VESALAYLGQPLCERDQDSINQAVAKDKALTPAKRAVQRKVVEMIQPAVVAAAS
jgi:hypothetical protein